MKKNFAIVGVGLIGGSLALKCRKNGLANRIVGVDSNHEHGLKAVELGLGPVAQAGLSEENQERVR